MIGEPPATILDLLARGRDEDPAILAPDRPPLRFAPLRALLCEVAGVLRARGLGPEDRVALVLPNGPEAATAFLAVACAAASAPLNPAYREEELDFYLDDLKAKAIVVSDREQGPAVTVAQRRGLELLRLSVPEGAEAGRFTLGEAPRSNRVPHPKPRRFSCTPRGRPAAPSSCR